jgi:phytoene dehydrogenase-like protein
MADYDVIVIGAGNGGLTAAAGLAQRGVRVLLLERHNVPGGCATSFVRGRFEFEVALHQLSGLGTPGQPGPLRGLLNQLGVLDKVEFVEEDTLYRAFVPGKLDVTLKADRSLLVAALKEKFPAEAAGVERFFDLVWEFCLQMVSIYFMHDPDASKEKYPLYFKYALKSSQEVLDEYLQDPYLKMAIAAYWGYIGLPPSRLSFTDLAMLLWAYTEFKPYHLKGGSQALSNAILDTFLQAGGRVRFNCAVRKILMAAGRVKGVQTEDGDEVSADYVISNASTISTYMELVDPAFAPPDKLRQLGSRSLGPSAFCVYCGLDCPPEDLGIQVSTQFISMDADMDRQFAAWRTLEPPDFCAMTCYNIADPSFSPPGTSEVVILTLQYADHWYAIPPAQYADTKFRYARGLLDIAEKVYPGFINSVEEMEISSPLTHLRYLGHPGGAFYGFDQYAKDSNLFIPPLSGIEGLYLAGAWVGMGGFQPTLESGIAAAKAVYKQLKK